MSQQVAFPKEEDRSAQAAALGRRLRAQRKHLRVSATAAAEAAGLSRVTLHRIERGEPSVSMGSYLATIAALGLALDLRDPQVAAPDLAPRGAAAALPERIELAAYPQLQALAWQRSHASSVTAAEALNLYERNWRHVQAAAMTPQEQALLHTLVHTLGGGRLLV